MGIGPQGGGGSGSGAGGGAPSPERFTLQGAQNGNSNSGAEDGWIFSQGNGESGRGSGWVMAYAGQIDAVTLNQFVSGQNNDYFGAALTAGTISIQVNGVEVGTVDFASQAQQNSGSSGKITSVQTVEEFDTPIPYAANDHVALRITAPSSGNASISTQALLHCSRSGGTAPAGALETVATDATITGDGTSGDPLSVANPYVAPTGASIQSLLDSHLGSSVWRSAHTVLRTAAQVRDLLDGLLGTGWRTGGGGSGITLDQAVDGAGALLAALGAFSYDSGANTLTFALRDADVPAAIARDTEVAAAYAALAGATFTGAAQGIDPTADAHFATKGYVDMVVMAGGEPTTSDDIYFGLSTDRTPEPAEATIAAMMGAGVVAAFTDRYMLIFRLASEPDIVSVLFSDDASQTNQIGAFEKHGSTVIPQGETAQFSVWVSRQLLTQPDSATVTVR